MRQIVKFITIVVLLNVLVMLTYFFLLPAMQTLAAVFFQNIQENNLTLNPVSYSHDPGFYTKPFLLRLESSLLNAKVLYTVDGSVPDQKNIMSDAEYADLPKATRSRTYEYTQPINMQDLWQRNNDIVEIPTTYTNWQMPQDKVEKIVIVRAQSLTKHSVSHIKSSTYVFHQEAESRYTLPVISIATDRGNLFDEKQGLFVPGLAYNEEASRPFTTGNYYQRGDSWEREASFELFDAKGTRLLVQDIGIRIHGGITRYLPQKSLRLYSRGDYGLSRFAFSFFETKELADFNRILLRNSGNGALTDLFRDALAQTLIQHWNIDTQHYQPAICYINGEYWGLLNIRDRYDEHYLETHYGIPRDEVTILSNYNQLKTGNEEHRAAYIDFVDQVYKGNLRYTELDKTIDVNNFIDYIIAQFYGANTDWPYNNIDFWRYSGESVSNDEGPYDGRWRWLVYDMDFTFDRIRQKSVSFQHEFDMVNFIFASLYSIWGREEAWSRWLIHGLLEFEEFRHEFIQRAAMHLNTSYHKSRVQEEILRMAAMLDAEILQHSERWGIPAIERELNLPIGIKDYKSETSPLQFVHEGSGNEAVLRWYNEILSMLYFAENRGDHFRQHIIDFFNEVDGMSDLRVSGLSSSHALQINSVLVGEGEPGVLIHQNSWSGRIFTGIPLRLESLNHKLADIEIEGEYHLLQKNDQEIILVPLGDLLVSLK